MFGRKNQNILSEHYTKLIDHSENEDTDDGGDFITLKRADHDLEDDEESLALNLSKRRLKEGESRRKMLRHKAAPTKLVFDEEGKSHAIYEMVDDEEFRKGDVRAEEAKFVERERTRLKEADLEDKELAKDKKKEKKRKRKDRERDVSLSFSRPALSSFNLLFFFLQRDAAGTEGPMVAAGSDDDDGYVSPDFDLPPLSDEENEVDSRAPLAKRARKQNQLPTRNSPNKYDLDHSLQDDEELVLQMLRGKSQKK